MTEDCDVAFLYSETLGQNLGLNTGAEITLRRVWGALDGTRAQTTRVEAVTYSSSEAGLEVCCALLGRDIEKRAVGPTQSVVQWCGRTPQVGSKALS